LVPPLTGRFTMRSRERSHVTMKLDLNLLRIVRLNCYYFNLVLVIVCRSLILVPITPGKPLAPAGFDVSVPGYQLKPLS